MGLSCMFSSRAWTTAWWRGETLRRAHGDGRAPGATVPGDSLTRWRGPGGGNRAWWGGLVRYALAIVSVVLLGLALGPPRDARAQAPPTANSEPRFPPEERGTRDVVENTGAGAAIGAPLAATDADSDRLTYAISGDDAGFFSFDTSTGQLRTRAALDHEDRTHYRSLTVSVHDGKDAQGNPDTSIDAELAVWVYVIDADEAGSVSLWPARARVGAVLRAGLSDPDGVRYRSWEWSSSADRSDWTIVSALGYDAQYTPRPSDSGRYLRAVAEYTDHEGGGKSAEAVTTYQVGDATPAPQLVVTTLVSGLTIPWDIAIAPDGTMLFTERGGKLSARTADGTVQAVTADLGDLRVAGETGLMAIVVDPGFATNRRFYTCQGHTGPEVQVIAWTIDDAYTSATRVADPLVGGILADSHGGHAGCRLRFGPQGHLWIAVGDAALGGVPQSLTALGGKILRVQPSTGAGVAGNPFPSSPLVYSYGHRNPQGLAQRPGTSQMWSVEHGHRSDDEINLLVRGGNYGWSPVVPDPQTPFYIDHGPMTDLVKFPSAIEARWSSGTPTLATSGGIFLEGDAWGSWEGRLAVASLANSTLRVFEFGPSGDLLSEVVVRELDGYGRLRSPVMGRDGALYVTTSNGGGADRILRVAPVQPFVLTGPTVVSYAEGGSRPVASYSARAANVTIAWSLSGDDAAAFRLDGGVLRFRAPPDHETPTDVGGDNRYDVTVHASDGIESRELDITITVTTEGPPPRIVVGGGSGGGGSSGGGGGGGPPPVPIPSDADFDWNVTRDIESLDHENDTPTGLWSDGQTLWVLENAASGADSVFAYGLESGERQPEREFELDRRNRFSHGIWSDGETVWIADSGQDLLFAYVLESGERNEGREFELAERNRDPRGIWSDDGVMYVLDSVQDSLFTYNFATGELLIEHALDKLNRSPRGIWSDGVTIWVSDDGAKRLFAYEFDGEALQRNEDLEFTFRSLLKAGNGSPRGIWSDGDVMYVVDEQDDKIYTYNLPDAIIAQLASLSLSDLELEEFSPDRRAYTAMADSGATVTTVVAIATQESAMVAIAPTDADSEPSNGHQVTLESETTITVMVRSADASRTKSYVVQVAKPPCLEGLNDEDLSEVTFAGGTVSELDACARSLDVDALYHRLDGVWTALFLSADLPEFINRPFRTRFPEGLPPGEPLIASRQMIVVTTPGTPDSS